MATTTAPISPKYVQMRAAVIYTGLSEFTLRDKALKGDLPAYRASDKPGSVYLFKLSDLDALMKPVIPAAITASR
ncbi:DNA-binding protein [Mycobacterium sp. 236(2023)]|uniref:DNA-binding protein n=1 Tax=Mycobacterium sp. 236(2023) TaxID=3038163 RepID=UPI00241591E6|nr:DNA-binding protein [Mycobacterium sp. 236(2023)]MDG4667821.1 DNA-binding protein [Mycobacterium sp. 236(2023)]